MENYVKNDLDSKNTCLILYKMYISFVRALVDRLRRTINDNWSYDDDDVIFVHFFSVILTKLFYQ